MAAICCLLLRVNTNCVLLLTLSLLSRFDLIVYVHLFVDMRVCACVYVRVHNVRVCVYRSMNRISGQGPKPNPSSHDAERPIPVPTPVPAFATTSSSNNNNNNNKLRSEEGR